MFRSDPLFAGAGAGEQSRLDVASQPAKTRPKRRRLKIWSLEHQADLFGAADARVLNTWTDDKFTLSPVEFERLSAAWGDPSTWRGRMVEVVEDPRFDDCNGRMIFPHG